MRQHDHFILYFYQPDTSRNKENVIRDDNDTCQPQSLHISDKGQENLLAGKKATRARIN